MLHRRQNLKHRTLHKITSHIASHIANSAWVNRREFADMRFLLLVPLWDCSNATPTPKFEASHIA